MYMGLCYHNTVFFSVCIWRVCIPIPKNAYEILNSPFRSIQKWATKSEIYTNAGTLLPRRNRFEESDKTFLAELDDVRKQIQNSPEHLILSIKAVMAEKKSECMLLIHASPFEPLYFERTR